MQTSTKRKSATIAKREMHGKLQTKVNLSARQQTLKNGEKRRRPPCPIKNAVSCEMRVPTNKRAFNEPIANLPHHRKLALEPLDCGFSKRFNDAFGLISKHSWTSRTKRKLRYQLAIPKPLWGKSRHRYAAPDSHSDSDTDTDSEPQIRTCRRQPGGTDWDCRQL